MRLGSLTLTAEEVRSLAGTCRQRLPGVVHLVEEINGMVITAATIMDVDEIVIGGILTNDLLNPRGRQYENALLVAEYFRSLQFDVSLPPREEGDEKDCLRRCKISWKEPTPVPKS